MTARRDALAIVLALLGSVASVGAGSAHAQSARVVGAEGIEAFRALDFEASVKSLRTLLAGTGASSLGDSVSAELLTYIGAAELLLGRRVEAMRTFRAALEHAPDGRPDTLVFPPAITTAFEEARRGTALVVARAAGAATFAAGRGRVEFRLKASAPHVVRASIQDQRGVVVRTLFDGPITDTLWLAWDGLLSSGAVAASGRAELCVTSIDADGIARALRLPLEVERLDVGSPTTAIAPIAVGTAGTVGPASLAARGHVTSRPARWPRLIPGLVAAASVVVLPEAISTRPEPSSRRYIVGGLLAAASIVAFRGAERPSSVPDTSVRPPARLGPIAPPPEMPGSAARAVTNRLRISPLATRARSVR
jgi:hypothetical protein